MTKWVYRDAKDKDALKKELKELENLIRRPDTSIAAME